MLTEKNEIILLDEDELEGNRVQYAQIKASQNGGLFVDKLALKAFLKKIEKNKNLVYNIFARFEGV